MTLLNRTKRMTQVICRTLTLTAMVWCFSSAVAEEDFAAQLPRIPVTEASQTLRNFSTVPGFEVQLVASEPLIGTPVAIEWDAKGHLYVCEMRGYSEERDEQLSRVSYLRDTNGDGQFDTGTAFVTGLLWPTAIFPFDDGLFVADAPHVYYCKDTNGDGTADVQEIVLTGFNVSNVQGLLNSFRWGLDNRIHLACGTVGGKVRRASDPVEAALEVRGRDLAFDPRTFEFELTSGGAQHGMCFDDWGRKFVCSNSDHIQQVVYEDRYAARNPWLRATGARVSIASDGPQAEVYRTSPIEPWRIVRTRLRVSGVTPGVVEGGGRAAGYFTGATGVTIYRGSAWPTDMLGMAIVGDVGGNLIHRKSLSEDTIPLVARRIDEEAEFVSSSDIWFRPAQFANAPDGSLHVVDVCREVIEHPASLPPQIKTHLDLTSGRERGRIYRIVPQGFQAAAVIGLDQASTAELVQTLFHRNSWQRETASRLLFQQQDAAAIDLLVEAFLQSDYPQGKLHALYALQGLGGLQPKLLQVALADEHPHIRRHAIRLFEPYVSDVDDLSALSACTADPSLETRFQLAFTAGYLPVKDRVQTLADLAARDGGHPWMRMAILSSAAEVADSLLLALLAHPDLQPTAMASLLQGLAVGVNDAKAIGELLPQMDQFVTTQPSLVVEVLGKLRQAVPREADRINQTLHRALQQLEMFVADPNHSLDAQVQALSSLSFGTWDQHGSLLIDFVQPNQPPALQLAAIRTLGKLKGVQVVEPLLEVWPSSTPRWREAAAEVLFSTPQRTAALLTAVNENRIKRTELPQTRLRMTAEKSPDPQLRDQAAAILRQFSNSSRESLISRYQDALRMTGDLQRGSQVFAKQCAGCHRVGNVGHELGPNLAMFATRGSETMLIHILDPNREIQPQYLNYVAITTDGKTVSGMIASESSTSIRLQRAEGATETILRNELEELQSTGVSLMPEGLEAEVDPQSMADLLAFLSDASRRQP